MMIGIYLTSNLVGVNSINMYLGLKYRMRLKFNPVFKYKCNHLNLRVCIVSPQWLFRNRKIYQVVVFMILNI
jgi:hypothetical protein